MIGASTFISAQEKYFHDLRGMEDSNGATHLFYRVFEEKTIDCSYYDSESDSYVPSTARTVDNNVYHFETATEVDTLKFTDTTHHYPDCYSTRGGTYKYTFFDNHPDSVFAIEFFYGGLSGGYFFPLQTEDYNVFELGFGNPLGVNFDQNLNSFLLTGKTSEIIIKAVDKDYAKGFGNSIRYSLQDTSWHDFTNFSEVPDSLYLDFLVAGINPYKKGHYVGFKDSSIVISTDYGQSFQRITTHNWELYDFYASDELLPQIPFLDETLFDADSSSFYLKFYSEASSRNLPSSLIYLVRQINDTWQYKSISTDHENYTITLDQSQSGSLYFSSENELHHSNDFGNSSNVIEYFDAPITGLYKKPNSELVFVLTSEKMFEYNLSTTDLIVLKVLPVTNEIQENQPYTITLHQNYPNPFNPSTVISYSIPKGSAVILRVFDQLGREVQTLENTYKQAGTHTVTFDASSLSSGVYFYVLEAKDLNERITQKMMLIK